MPDWVSLTVAVAALLFTITSFWWLNARRGRLVSYDPHSFAAHVSPDDVHLRLPLVLFNTGAQPIVIQQLRVRFPDEDEPDKALTWGITRRQLRPDQDDYQDLRAAFAVPGRAVLQRFIEFRGPFPGKVPRGRDYQGLIEVRLGHRAGWTPLLRFTLHAAHIKYPSNFIAYSNTPELTRDEAKKAKMAAEALLPESERDDSAPGAPPGEIAT